MLGADLKVRREMPTVFVSYAHQNRDRVEDIVDGLRRSRLAVWWDEELPPGRNWDDQLESALEKASTILIVWSADAVASENVKDEAYYAREENKALPIRIEDVKPPFRFRRMQFVDLFRAPAESNDSWRDLVEALAERLGREPGTATEPAKEAPSVRDGVALPLRMVFPSLLVALSLVSHVGGTLLLGPESRVPVSASWGLGGAGLALAVSNLLEWRGR